MRGLKKKQCSLGDLHVQCTCTWRVSELYLAHTQCLSNAPTCIVRHTETSLRLRLVPQELALCGNAYPMMPHSRPGRGSKNLITMLIVRACIWSTMPCYGLQQAGILHVHVGYRLTCRQINFFSSNFIL